MVLHTYTCDYYIFWEYDVFINYKEIFFIPLQTYLSKYEKNTGFSPAYSRIQVWFDMI